MESYRCEFNRAFYKKEAMKIMVNQKTGRIINIGSISGQMSREETRRILQVNRFRGINKSFCFRWKRAWCIKYYSSKM